MKSNQFSGQMTLIDLTVSELLLVTQSDLRGVVNLSSD